MAGNIEVICRCYLTNNIFIKSCGIHFTYRGDKEFKNDYKQFFLVHGYQNKKINSILKEIHAEIERRKENGKLSKFRKQLIKNSYTPLHRDIYILKEQYLNKEFLSMVEYACQPTATREGLISKLLKTDDSTIFLLRVFTEEFCETFVEEINNFNLTGLPKGKPNTMNMSGVLLGELGFNENFFDVFRTKYLNPLFSMLYPNWVGNSGFDSHRAFVVIYDCEKEEPDDTGLSLHYDNAEATINVCLTCDFKDGELFFNGMRNTKSSKFTKVEHRFSFGVLHRGQHLHGAMPISVGKRYNLVMWLRSSDVRNSLCPMCDSAPSLIETEGDGDGFTTSNPILNVCEII